MLNCALAKNFEFDFMDTSSSWKGLAGKPWLCAHVTPVIIKVCFEISFKQNIQDERLGGCQLILVWRITGKFYDYALSDWFREKLAEYKKEKL